MLKDLWLVLRGQLDSADLRIVQHQRDAWERQAEDYLRLYETEQHRLSAAMTQIMHTDESLFRMSQCSSWDQLRPIFALLMTQAEGCRKHVSDRVGEREIARMRSEAGL